MGICNVEILNKMQIEEHYIVRLKYKSLSSSENVDNVDITRAWESVNIFGLCQEVAYVLSSQSSVNHV